MPDSSSLEAVLEHMLRRASQQGQIESYGPRTHLYRHGLYSNTTSLWSHSPALALNHPGRYLITVQPQQSLRLAILRKDEFDQLLHESWAEEGSITQALNRLCSCLDRCSWHSAIDGFASYRLDPGPHYHHIIIFRPLQSLALTDIERL
ncbi:MAG: hypothetical protein OIF57_11355 [Marinobacterium sp.]|nr:hypothetical protein [Marinobacterium sp.]